MTREEFFDSHELLYRGVLNKDFIFESWQIDKKWFTDNSVTLWNGFYTTNNREAALSYAKGGALDISWKLIILLPYNTRLLKCYDNGKDLPIPRYIVDDFILSVLEYWNDIDKVKNWKYAFQRNKALSYYNAMLDFMKHNPDYLPSIRVLLQTVNKPIDSFMKSIDKGLYWIDSQSPDIIGRVLKKYNIDGLIYPEGVDNNPNMIADSYVFYNTNKIGTYENWSARSDVQVKIEKIFE